MTDDQQAGTLAFLQNFYTGVTLYMPFEAAERQQSTAPSELAVPLVSAAAPAAPAGPAAVVAPAVAPVPAVAPIPPVPAIQPADAGPGKMPGLATLPAAPERPATPAAPTPVPPVATPVAAAPPPAAPAPVAPHLRTTFNTLGANAQGVVILVRLPETQFQKLPRNVFLNKLLQAIQLVMADVVLVNVDGPYPVALESLRREIAATQVLAFGKNLLDVAVRTTHIYEPVLFPNLNLAYLAAAEVEMVEYDTSLKKRLWSGLKAMFLSA